MLNELKLHSEALASAVEANPKFFASILHYVRRLKELLTSSQSELSKNELRIVSGKIEEFFQKWRPSGNGLYIPPREAEDADPTVREINSLVAKLGSLPDSEFLALLSPKDTKEKRFNASQSKTAGPCIFVGHGRSKLWGRVQVFVENELGVPVVTYESEPRTGESIVPVLEKMLDQATFAILVLTAEDMTPEGTKRVRQNVVHEAGLFQGRLGFKRAVMLIQDGIEGFSNVDGLQVIFFSKERVEQTFYELQRVLKREGQIA